MTFNRSNYAMAQMTNREYDKLIDLMRAYHRKGDFAICHKIFDDSRFAAYALGRYESLPEILDKSEEEQS